jgi:D-glycero-D-manno-heptose 1,7-bisphosphate phosphatase
MQCVILVGGLGSRLGEITKSAPKPMLCVGGQPFLRWLVENLNRFGVDEFILLAGYRAEVIEQYFDKIALDARIKVVKEPEPLGTGGAIRLAMPFLENQFFLMNGDSWLDFNILDLATAAWPETAIVRMALRHVSDVGRFGSVDLASDGVVRKFNEKCKICEPGLINGGVYYVDRDGLGSFIPDGRACSLELDVFPNVAANSQLFARLYEGVFIDIGIPAELNAAQAMFPIRRGAVFFDRDGVLNHDYGYVHQPKDFLWIDGAIDTIRRVNDEGRYAFVVTNQAGIARGMYVEEDVHQLHSWMNKELARVGAHIDAYAYCPHHPDGILPKFAITCDRRKPAPGMILGLMSKWPIDPAKSVLVGDKESDMIAAASAGIRGVHFSGGKLSEVEGIFDR